MCHRDDYRIKVRSRCAHTDAPVEFKSTFYYDKAGNYRFVNLDGTPYTFPSSEQKRMAVAYIQECWKGETPTDDGQVFSLPMGEHAKPKFLRATTEGCLPLLKFRCDFGALSAKEHEIAKIRKIEAQVVKRYKDPLLDELYMERSRLQVEACHLAPKI